MPVSASAFRSGPLSKTLTHDVELTMMSRMKIRAALTAFLCLLMVPVQAAERPDFAFDMFRQVVEAQRGNVVFSPLSVEGVLRLLQQGARGETAVELARLRMPERSMPVAMQPAQADAIFIDKSWKLKPGIKVDEIIPAPLMSDAKASADMVNGWAEDKTRGMIPSIIKPSDLAGNNCCMIAANAIALEEKWSIPFSPDATRQSAFHGADGKDKEVPMMYKTARFSYAEGVDWKALALFFRSEDRMGSPGCFLAILPRKNAREWASSLTSERFGVICKALREAAPCQVRVGMPRFEQRTDTFSLTSALKACGVRLIFTPMADLSGFTDAPLYLSEVLQRCYVKADEQGAKAAAVTVGIVRCFSAAPPRRVETFIMDRPFIWAITDLENQAAPYFMGLYEQP